MEQLGCTDSIPFPVALGEQCRLFQKAMFSFYFCFKARVWFSGAKIPETENCPKWFPKRVSAPWNFSLTMPEMKYTCLQVCIVKRKEKATRNYHIYIQSQCQVFGDPGRDPRATLHSAQNGPHFHPHYLPPIFMPLTCLCVLPLPVCKVFHCA